MGLAWTAARSRGLTALLVLACLGLESFAWSQDTSLRWGGNVSGAALIVGAVTAYSALFWRSRYPVAVYAIVWTFSLVGVLVPAYEPFAGLLVGLHAVARRSPHRTALLALGAAALPLGINTVNAASMYGSPDLLNVLIVGSLWAVLAVGAWAMGRGVHEGRTQAREHEAELTAARATAVRAERARIARDLHDIVAHSVSAIVLQAAGARAVQGPGPDEQRTVDAALAAIETTGAQAMRELHRLLGLLRSDDAAIGAVGPHARLREVDGLLTLTRQCGLRVDLDVVGADRCLDPSVEHAAYRVIQESLSNAMKYAGRGGAATIVLAWSEHALDVSVRSTDGPGGDGVIPVHGGHGLAGLAERVNLVGGRFSAGRVTGGFVTHAALPVRRQVPAGVLPPRSVP